MAAVYPGTIATIASNKSDDIDSKSGADLGLSSTTGDHATHHNKLAEELVATQTELGTDPSASFATVAARLNARITCRKTANQTIAANTSALANLTDLTMPIATTALDYYFKFIIAWQTATATVGLRLGLTCPALTGYISARVGFGQTDVNPAAGSAQTATAITDIEKVGFITSSGDSVVTPGAAATGTFYIATIEGILSNPSATGNLQVQGAGELSASGAAIIVGRGSYGEMYIN